jgi:outer membrane protein assembly factor BamD (BamD/ComL family)
MRKFVFAGCLALALLGCGDQAKELFETAQFEELQSNAPHARQLYQEIVDQYPASPYAAQARERLGALKTP